MNEKSEKILTSEFSAETKKLLGPSFVVPMFQGPLFISGISDLVMVEF